MSFAGKVWKLLVGIKDGLVLLFMLLFFLLLFTVLSARPSPEQVREGALLIELDGFIVEEATPIDPFAALLSGEAPMMEYEARKLVRAIDAAAGDERIKAVVLDLSRFVGGGQVHLQEIGEAMDRVRQTEKPVLVYGFALGDDHVQLASHASEVWIDPLGGALVAGPGGNFMFYGDLFDRFGVNARIYRAGTFKSAVEPYSRNSFSPEARENLESLYAVLWEEWQANVKKARPGFELDTVTTDPVAWVEASQGDLAQAALSVGLVDKLGDPVEFGKRVAEIVGEDKWSDAPGAYPHTTLATYVVDTEPDQVGKAIGVVTIAGTIVDGEAGPGTAGGTRIADLLDDALDDDLAALVVRVDSPGGSVTASEEIRRAIARHKAKGIPVAVSFANVAASGGYWVATSSDRIFAQPETITGSIGVFAVLPTFEKAASDLGVGFDGVRTTPLSGQPDLLGGLTPEVDAILQSGVEKTYSQFLSRVAEARGFSVERADQLAQGRVWDGGAARQSGLVDQFGGLDDAIEWAAAQAGLEEGGWHARFLGSQMPNYDSLIRQLLVSAVSPEQPERSAGVYSLVSEQQSQALTRVARDFEMITGYHGVQAYCLGCPSLEKASAKRDAQGLISGLSTLLEK